MPGASSGVTDDDGQPCGSWELNLGPLEEQNIQATTLGPVLNALKTTPLIGKDDALCTLSIWKTEAGGSM